MGVEDVPNLLPDERRALLEFGACVTKAFPNRVRLVRLFGSKARGDAKPESDVDVLVVVDRDEYGLWREIQDIAADTSLKHGVFLSVKVMSREHYSFLHSMETSFVRNIEREGVDIWTP